MTKFKSNRLAPYMSSLKAVSARTGTTLPSLMVSFAILHEITAFVPLIGIFVGAQALGVGQRVGNLIKDGPGGTEMGWIRETCRGLVDEGELWASRIGKRYGIWGFQKGEESTYSGGVQIPRRIADDIANAAVAYGITKALLPFRIGLSLYLSPAFSKQILSPFQLTIQRAFRRRPPS